MRTLLVALVFLLTAAAARAEPGTAARELDMRADPRNDARVTGKLARGARFELLKRQGVWAQISADGRQGWVLFFYLAFGNAPPPDAGRELAGAARLATARPAGDITATIGTRGLSEEQLRSAGFNAQEMKRLEGFAVPADAAEQFARQGGLSARRVELPSPAGAGSNVAPFASSSGD